MPLGTRCTYDPTVPELHRELMEFWWSNDVQVLEWSAGSYGHSTECTCWHCRALEETRRRGFCNVPATD